ncbi:WYL domain-containing protein [Acidobacteria bacterium AH-259-L09]|nr:WYL domain-containing protein [Acidobacteria bacterium AH-259-L09]
MNRTERLLDLITYLLNAREPVSWQDIKNHFPQDYAKGVEESNQRKFERDKAELISLGIPIDYYSGTSVKKEGYIIEKEKLFLPEIQFTPQESSLLMLSVSAVLENEGFPYRDQLESALHKIISINDHISPPPPEITITYAAGRRPSARSTWVNEIQDSLDRRKTIEIVYHAFSTGETTRREVDPYGLIFRRGNWTLIGWDHLRKDLRSFVLTRIKDLKINPRRPGTPDYEIPEDFSLKGYQNQQQWELDFHEPIRVTIRVSPHRLPELLPQLTTAKRANANTFHLKVTNRSGLISWILSQKTDVQVVDPKEIRDEIREVLHKLL